MGKPGKQGHLALELTRVLPREGALWWAKTEPVAANHQPEEHIPDRGSSCMAGH